jgi:DNA-directed RNA polymerase subunit H (RpoH/RPB5)
MIIIIQNKMAASSSPLLLPLTKNRNIIQTTIITNIVKMTIARKWMTFAGDDLDKLVKHVIEGEVDDGVFKIKLNEEYGNLIIKLLSQKISGKNPIIATFLNAYVNERKILVLDSIVDNTKANLLKQSPNLEIFNESFFMFNILEHVYSPKYIKLDPEEIKQVLASYQQTKNDTKKMFDTDPASLYLNLKKGDMVRIIRNSEQTGKSIDYRVVITQGNIHN